MPAKTRNLFFDLGIYVDNVFGMSETAGPMTGLFKDEYKNYNLKSAGRTIDGTKGYVLENGELCFRGRNVLMGYLKNEEATRSTIDELRRLHSGDKGEFDTNGNIMITGRIKELLKTAGGEYVAPVIIENLLKEQLPFVSNAMVIGDQKKFVSVMITVKTTTLPSDAPVRTLDPETMKFFHSNGLEGV
jgi:long-chain-fatty-acid--CoA ligase ACSBG